MIDFSWLTGWFDAFLSWLVTLATWILNGAVTVVEAALYYPFDGLLTTIETFVSGLDLSALAFSYTSMWAGLPPQFVYFVNAVGIPQGLSMIIAAVGIRMVINLIPAAFTRI